MSRSNPLFIGTLVLLVLANQGLSLMPDKRTVTLIKDAVFEVVALKPAEDYIEYDKPLPLDLIPFAIRNDKYLPIGTAFAVNESTLATAAHVFSLYMKSQYAPISIRDSEGRIYQVDRVTGYSTWRDVMYFTLKGKKFTRFFTQNTKPVLNEPVFAVGNALGEGIVIRDGLLVSETYESESGQWKWLRFSAAASPGNSGGPLLDKNGRIIGIITMKSENENLNFALPVSEAVKQLGRPALLHMKSVYTLPNCSFQKLMTIDLEAALPCAYDTVRKQLHDDYCQIIENKYYDLLKENRAQTFPFGPGSINLQYDISYKNYPNIIGQAKDGHWTTYIPNSTSTADLGDNGSLTYGGIYGYLLMNLRTPDSIAVADIFSNSKMLMDLLLKGLPFDRNIGNTSAKILSLGPAIDQTVFRDDFGRRWAVLTWNISYSDESIILFTLPTPDGAICLMRAVPTSILDNGVVLDMHFLADMMFFSYYGTLKNWRDFLSHPELLPEDFPVSLGNGNGAGYSFKADWLTVDLKKGPYSMNDDSDLRLRFGYSAAGEKAVWSIRGITVGQSKDNSNFYSVTATPKPVPEADNDYRADWQKKLTGEHPYNQTGYYEDQLTYIARILTNAGGGAKEPTVAYLIKCGQEGTAPEKDMRRMLDKVSKSITIKQP